MKRIQGTIRAVILDWAGTTIDHGSLAPTRVFLEVFHREGVEITIPEARGPMGKAKRDHIAEILALPRVAQAWQSRHGQPPTDDDVDRLYRDFLPLQKQTLSRYSQPIPGVPEAIQELRSRGLKIGSTTGYTRELMDVVAPLAAAAGYAPEVIVCSDEVRAGRPAPWMNFRAAELLGIYPMNTVVVVDDTPVGMEAARNAGAIAVGVALTGNGLGLSDRELAEIPLHELEVQEAAIALDLRAAGAQYVIPSVAELPKLLARLESV